MLEKHHPPQEPVWDINNLWLAFLFLCLCWVAVMVIIIHSDTLKRNRVETMHMERAHLVAQLLSLGQSDPQSAERLDVETRLQNLRTRLEAAQQPPTMLFMLFSVFEGVFILGFYVLLFRLRRQVRSAMLRLYLAALPLGFIYFFLLITLGRYHTWQQLVGDSSTTALTATVAVFFALGFVIIGSTSLFRQRSDTVSETEGDRSSPA